MAFCIRHSAFCISDLALHCIASQALDLGWFGSARFVFTAGWLPRRCIISIHCVELLLMLFLFRTIPSHHSVFCFSPFMLLILWLLVSRRRCRLEMVLVGYPARSLCEIMPMPMTCTYLPV
ncbi:hypothetical protein BDV19DRAFT_341675 [Aspergillus venezuelensis]